MATRFSAAQYAIDGVGIVNLTTSEEAAKAASNAAAATDSATLAAEQTAKLGLIASGRTKLSALGFSEAEIDAYLGV